jgi:hypothetical protein
MSGRNAYKPGIQVLSNEFLENAKQSGLVKRIMESLALQEAKVAPAEKLRLR